MLARRSSSFSIKRSLVSPKRHRDAMSNAQQKLESKVVQNSVAIFLSLSLKPRARSFSTSQLNPLAFWSWATVAGLPSFLLTF